MSTEDNRILVLKENFQSILESWTSHWDKLVQDKFWGENIFLQSSAMLLNSNIMIISTSSTDGNPWTYIQGQLIDGGCPEMVLGYTGSHYQSLLPVNLPVSVQQSISSIPASEDFRVPNTSKKSAIDLKREKAKCHSCQLL